MKKYPNIAIMAVTALAIAGFTRCIPHDGPDPDKGKKAILKISLANPVMNGTRASGTLPVDNAVNEFSVFVFNADGTLAAKQHFNNNGGGDEEIDVTTKAKEVYVIANAGDQRNNYSTKADLTTKVVGLVSTQYALNNAKRWATGKAELGSFSNDPTPVAAATVHLDFIAARVTLTVVNNMTNTGLPGAADITDVAVLNGRGQSRLFPGAGSSLIPQSTDTGYDAASQYLGGLDNISTFNYKPDAALYTSSVAEMKTAYNSEEQSYFYVFENDATTKEAFPTIITVVAAAGAAKAYFPVHLAPYETFTVPTVKLANGVVRGNSYDVTITLTGDATAAISRGTGDPTVPLLNAHVNVELDINPWTAVSLGKVF